MRIENSFIPVEGVGERTERTLWRAGVTHWDRFDGSVVGATLADRIDAFIDDARDRLRAGDARFFADRLPSRSRWRLYETFREGACFFDIETTGLDMDRDTVTTVSCHTAERTTTLVRGRDLTTERLRSVFDGASLLVTFNGSQFDLPFLERSFDLAVDHPHVDLRWPCQRLGLTGGLKAIETLIGLDRAQPDISGRDAVRLWHAYERGDDDALETLIAYNREDARNLRPLMDHVASALHERVFEADTAG